MTEELRFAAAVSSRRPRRSSFSAWGEDYEVHADRVIEGGREVVLDVAHEHAGLAHS